ncbi:MAG: DUF3553 domain-containing protein [Pseudomonadota bacterium]
MLLEPGTIVRNPECPEWGIGQIQSVTGNRATVNFQEIGKTIVFLDAVSLEILSEDLY